MAMWCTFVSFGVRQCLHSLINKDNQPEVLSIDAPDLVHQLTKLLRAHVIFIPTDASLCMCGTDAEEMVVNKKAGCDRGTV